MTVNPGIEAPIETSLEGWVMELPEDEAPCNAVPCNRGAEWLGWGLCGCDLGHVCQGHKTSTDLLVPQYRKWDCTQCGGPATPITWMPI